MATEFKTKEEEKAYQLGKLDGMLYHISHILKNLKLEYEKIYQKKLDLEKSQEK